MLRPFLAATVLSLGATATFAADFSFRGNFTADDDVQLFDFTVGSQSSVTLRSYSYAGGVQADGTTVSNGGFDPILALFDANGDLIDQNDDGASVPTDATTGEAFDTLLEAILDAGDYTVAIMQYDNFAAGSNLSDGFTQSGNFTFGDCTANIFCDVAGDSRSSFWAFDVLGVDTATTPPPAAVVPLPATLPMLLGALVWAGSRRRS